MTREVKQRTSGMTSRVLVAMLGLVACAVLWSGPLAALAQSSSTAAADVATSGTAHSSTVASAATPADQLSTSTSPLPSLPESPAPTDSSQPSVNVSSAGQTAAPDLELEIFAPPAAEANAPVFEGPYVRQVITVIVPPHDLPQSPEAPPTTTAGSGATNGEMQPPGLSGGEQGAHNDNGGGAQGAALPPTGLGPFTLRLLVLGLVLVDLGWLCTALARRRERTRPAA